MAIRILEWATTTRGGCMNCTRPAGEITELRFGSGNMHTSVRLCLRCFQVLRDKVDLRVRTQHAVDKMPGERKR